MPWPLRLVQCPTKRLRLDSALKCFNDLFYQTFRSLHLHFSHNPLQSRFSPFDQTTCSLMEGAKMPSPV
ncbi:MAG TPA: hypothetical protein VKB35_05285 [Ktedonobacteraceae bacterium]|nr:hypothetical protein [Ktedonobacteraceae bacterium]